MIALLLSSSSMSVLTVILYGCTCGAATLWIFDDDKIFPWFALSLLILSLLSRLL